MFTKQKHQCPNRSESVTQTTTTSAAAKPNYYNNNKFTKQSKPKMSNSLELLTGPTIADIQKKYEILSDIVIEASGRVHGSQRDRDPKTGMIDLLVYYEVPAEGNKEMR